ncbi:uncharacterized protein N7459_002039 [Penicillium hispanicum]|uniref:uncharacterized protein n=1 Tax=Penicillium hispanicum TaxID=1080232 RepID=UPI002541049B|nr:uncharacterized protein N7459_002039 [Penicillium hispanicum]KAJ5591670.1 hypothetical protein N7459_002039 [Penicillium hispanicum]
MSYVYRERERDRDWDDRPVTIKRYVIPSEDREDRRDFMMSRDDPYSGDRELVIRRKTDREEPMSIQRYEREIDYDPPVRRYERDYERDHYDSEYLGPSSTFHHHRFSSSLDTLERPLRRDPPVIMLDQSVIVRPARNAYASPRESEYEMIRRSDAEEDPYYYHRRRRVRELSPGDSISQISRRRSDRDQDYSSDDSMVYIRKETRDYDGEHPHHKRHLAEGALVGVGAAELLRSHRKRDGEEVSHGMSHAMKTAGAGALGAVAVNAAGHVRDYYRSKSRSRHRSHSFDDDRSHRYSHHSRGRRSRSRSRSHSHSRSKTLMELGLGAVAVAAGVAAMQKKKNNDERRSRSRTRSRSRARGLSTSRSEKDDARSQSQRRKHMAGAGLAGAAVAGLVEHQINRSRSRKGERSHSRIRKALPVVAAGLGTAAATGFYEKKKAEKDDKETVSRERRRSRSRSRGPSDMYPDPARDSAGLIEYGHDPVTGSIPADHYYGAPASPNTAYYSDGAEYGRRRSRSRSRSRGARYSGSSSGSDREGRRNRSSKKHRSRSREIAEAALGATGLGYAAHKYAQHRDRKKAEKEHSRSRYEDDAHRDPYEEAYDPEPYPASPHAPPAQPADNYYPNTNYFPPPPGSTPNLNTTPNPYNPGDYPPPPGAAPPPQPYSYGGAGPGPETYAPRPRRADENVSAAESSILATDQYHKPDGLGIYAQPPQQTTSVPGSGSQPAHSKSVAFDLGSDPSHRMRPDPGYETDDSDSTIDSHGHRSHRDRHHRRRSSVLYSDKPHSHSDKDRTSSAARPQHSSAQSQDAYKVPESESDSTIDLPDRFDTHGRLLPEKDPAAEKFEDFMKKFTRVLI